MRKPLPKMTHLQRVARAQEKADIILKFLGSGEVFTTAEVASTLLGVDRSRAAATLKALEKQGALKSEVHHVNARNITIYGITPHGLAMVDCFGNPFIELGRTNGGGIEHRLASQAMRIKAEAAGWSGWIPERAIRLVKGLKKIPDAIAVDAAGNRIAFEVERSLKTPKRYEEIMVLYLQEIKAGKYTEVHYVSPDGVEKLVAKAFSRIETVKFNGGKVKVEQSHRDRFKFFSFSTAFAPKTAESEA